MRGQKAQRHHLVEVKKGKQEDMFRQKILFVDNKENVVPPGRESEKANSNENLAHKAS